LDSQERLGSKFKFPDKEIRQVIVLNQEETEKYFYIYDIYMNRFTRKILKQDYYEIHSQSNSNNSDAPAKKKKKKAAPDPESFFRSDAFDIDPNGDMIIYAYGR
jgi:hypothetical protein